MNSQTVLSKIKNYLLFVGEDVLLLCSVGLAVLIFTVVFIFGMVKRRNFQKLRSTYLSLGVGLVLIVCAISVLCSEKISTQTVIFIPTITAGIYAFLYVPTALFCGRVKVKPKHKELIEKLDLKINSDEPEFLPKEIKDYKNVPERESVSMLYPEKEQLKPNIDVDFTHVRNVISRLDYFGLSQSDKKTVDELSSSLNLAESSGFDEALKNRINDGLGALLKIMSKYSV